MRKGWKRWWRGWTERLTMVWMPEEAVAMWQGRRRRWLAVRGLAVLGALWVGVAAHAMGDSLIPFVMAAWVAMMMCGFGAILGGLIGLVSGLIALGIPRYRDCDRVLLVIKRTFIGAALGLIPGLVFGAYALTGDATSSR